MRHTGQSLGMKAAFTISGLGRHVVKAILTPSSGEPSSVPSPEVMGSEGSQGAALIVTSARRKAEHSVHQGVVSTTIRPHPGLVRTDATATLSAGLKDLEMMTEEQYRTSPSA